MAKTWADVWEFRASLYNLLGSLLIEPIQADKKQVFTKSFWEDFPLEAANKNLKSGLERLVKATVELQGLEVGEQIQEVMVEYTKLFLGPGHPDAPPFESYYQSDKKLFFGNETFAMKHKLREFGLESKRQGKQPEDHIGLELLFLSVQTDKIKESSYEEQVKIVKEQIYFIENHILSWVPRLTEDAIKHASIGFYGGLFELIVGVVEWDRELLEEFVTKVTVKES